MGIWGEFNVKQEQRRDLLRRVEQQRLVRQTLAGRSQPGRSSATFQTSMFQKFFSGDLGIRR